jgi:hypothetical protein
MVMPIRSPFLVVAERMALGRLVEVDGAPGVADAEVENVGVGVVVCGVEVDRRDGAHGNDLRANAVRT